MKHILALCLSLLFLSVDFAHAETVADYPGGVAASGIAGSRHNLGSLGPSGLVGGTTEICVFCHTPHHAQTVPLAPLWNRYNATDNFTAYGTTLSGRSVTDIGSVSLACLSCHDGVTTFDNIINSPGAGDLWTGEVVEYVPGWRLQDGQCRTRITALIDGQYMSSFGSYLPMNITDMFDAQGIKWWSFEYCRHGTSVTAVEIDSYHGISINIGTDLTNDHPVSIVYDESVGSLRPKNTVIGSIDLTTGLAESADTAFNGNLAQNRWAIKGFIDDGVARISDLLRDGRVECSSCHDPHFSNKSFDEVEGVGGYEGLPEKRMDGLFLRRVGGNTGSGVCRTCHNK
ncbi:MAG: hypothetical protein HYV24_09895 [Deltaproteobacteria bacterium]|nr:hypothetical protein [Deltaproteobacteria bacterium]